ncbi:exonuclease domain-containing protein [Methanoregula sp.]|jgi:DNA polymerase III epsilon subunit-like protein|uniref:3'-5' exonuclease n=1 Tax=Methanoregula sp. TaxID=2052170 RepID=UPI003C753C93
MLLFVDTETSGLPNYSATADFEKWPRVVQLAWSLYDNDGNRESLNNFIIYHTDFVISPGSVRVHGITTEKAKKEGVSLNKVLPLFNADIEKTELIIAHNVQFDLPVINSEFLRCNLETNLLKKSTFCTMKTSKIVSFCRLPKPSGNGYKWPQLSELYVKLFKTELTESHNASVDVDACAKCYFELQKRGIIE